MNKRLQLICAWCGPAFLLFFVVGFWFVAGLVPPPSPAHNAAQIAAFYRDNAGQVRAGMVICMVGLPLFIPFAALLSQHIRERNPELALLADVQMVCAAVAVMVFLVFEILLATIVFRPEISPDTIRTLNDAAWTTLLWPFSPFSLEYAIVGVWILADRSERPLHPRWVGYIGLLTAFVFAFGGPTLWVKDGAFSYDGALAFWAVLVAFGAWVMATAWTLIRSIKAAPQQA